ncbi:MAG: ROK family protein [Phycisphaerales bacterium]|nr:ROK family protein [Phycisphaerales bacterium]
MSPSKELAIGIDLGGTNAQVGLVDPIGHLTNRIHMPTNAADGWQATISRLATGVRQVCAEAHTDVNACEALGIGAPGTIDGDTIVEAPNLRWTNVPLVSALQDALATHLPIALDNDVNCATLAEARFGAARNERNLLGVWVGTGIGGGIILDGSLVRGPLGSAGEIGRTLLLSTNPIGMRRLEDICSRAAVTRRLHELARSNHATSLRDTMMATDDPLTVPARAITEAYAAHDALTRAVVDESADLLGRGIASACTLLGTPLVILGGGLTEALGQPYIDMIHTSCNTHVLPRLQGKVECRMTALGPDAGIIGAASVARDAIR